MHEACTVHTYIYFYKHSVCIYKNDTKDKEFSRWPWPSFWPLTCEDLCCLLGLSCLRALPFERHLPVPEGKPVKFKIFTVTFNDLLARMHANGTGKCNSYCNYRYIFTFICIVIINFFIIIFWRLLQFQIISIMVNVKKIKKTMWVDRLQFLIQLINYLA